MVKPQQIEPTGFEDCLCPGAVETLSGLFFLFQKKEDGIRVLWHCLERNYLTGRKVVRDRFNEFQDSYPQIRDTKCHNLLNSVFDCELVNGRLIVFDVLFLNGEDLQQLPLRTRWAKLLAVQLPDFANLVESSDDAAKLLKQVRSIGGEGITAKTLHGKYGEGWIKIKEEETFDVIVTGKSKGALCVAQNHNTALHDCGKVRASASVIESLSIGDVIEVRSFEQFDSGKFRSGVFTRTRPDKPASACLLCI